jgi:pimeloyl-ACP methyl ester carboxylesterase
MTLSFVRFPTTNPNPGRPIVYLAGGPGGSGIGTARGARFPLFMALREVADVIALDQRGTGASEPPDGCRANRTFPTDQPLLRENWIRYARAAALECEQQWLEKGIDLSAFSTWQSARDLEVLRTKLGAEKINLWGISYGTHLAMAAIKVMPEGIERIVMASPEGLDQTVKLPQRADRFYERVEASIKEAGMSDRYPDLVKTMRGVLEQLDREPATVTVTPGEGAEPFTFQFDSTVIRFYTAFFLSKNPSNIARLPATYAALAAGQYDQIAMGIHQLIYANPTRFSAMSLAMDIASGISPQRSDKVRKQASHAILADWMNYPMPMLATGINSIPDLGESFREPLKSDLPVLILTGTLDGRTFPEAHSEVLSQFENGQQIIIKNAGHDLFMVSPKVTVAIRNFLTTGQAGIDRIDLPPPNFL